MITIAIIVYLKSYSIVQSNNNNAKYTYVFENA